jgi:hypothetical protein
MSVCQSFLKFRRVLISSSSGSSIPRRIYRHFRNYRPKDTQHHTPEDLKLQQSRHDIVVHTNQKFFSIYNKLWFSNLRRLTSNTKSVHTSQTIFLFHVEIVCLHPTCCSTRITKIF